MSQASGNPLVLEALEGRTLLSASVAADLLSASPDIGVPVGLATSLNESPTPPGGITVLPFNHVRAVGPTTPLTGAFNVAGTYTVPFSRNPDAGSVYHFTGSGKKRSLGSFTMAGDLHGLGFVATGRFRGYVTFTSSQGTIDVRLLGPEQGPGGLPATLAFKIVGGSGTYAPKLRQGPGVSSPRRTRRTSSCSGSIRRVIRRQVIRARARRIGG